MINDIYGDIQTEVAAWATKNFGQVPSGYVMLGLVEEIGEFYQVSFGGAVIANYEDAIGDQVIYAMNLCEKVGLSFAADVASDDIVSIVLERQLLVALGKASHGLLKNFQGIRGVTAAKCAELVRNALRVWWRWVNYMVNNLELSDVEDIVLRTWNDVKKRDWVKNAESAHIQ